MCVVQGPQRSDAGEARTRGPSFSSQALYYWATALSSTSILKETYSHLWFSRREGPDPLSAPSGSANVH